VLCSLHIWAFPCFVGFILKYLLCLFSILFTLQRKTRLKWITGFKPHSYSEVKTKPKLYLADTIACSSSSAHYCPIKGTLNKWRASVWGDPGSERAQYSCVLECLWWGVASPWVLNTVSWGVLKSYLAFLHPFYHFIISTSFIKYKTFQKHPHYPKCLHQMLRRLEVL
jgi:hypothetical protein